MKFASTAYNERSWAIDIISEINRIVQIRRRVIRRAGGERTIKGPSRRLFPDVLLFGSSGSGQILQGWELKMPDTEITDPEFLANAKEKAGLLGLNSFLLWNVAEASLYVLDNKDGWTRHSHWAPLPGIRRDEVEASRSQWMSFLEMLIDQLNDFFEAGTIKHNAIVEALDVETLVMLLLENKEAVADSLRAKAKVDGYFRAEVSVWWSTSRREHPDEKNMWHALAKANILHWINKFIFAHYLKRFRLEAKWVDGIGPGSTVPEALNCFKQISDACDFMNIFDTGLGAEVLDPGTWEELLSLNAFLTDMRFDHIDHTVLQRMLERSILSSKRRVAGQYATPMPLARFLVRQTLVDTGVSVIDPFCGTGTLAKAAFQEKKKAGWDSKVALASVWASDKFSFPVQIASLALSDPEAIGEVLHVFREDALKLSVGMGLRFQDPIKGSPVTKKLPRFGAIVSNLPFVRQEDINTANPQAKEINQWLEEQGFKHLPGKADLYAYLPFYLWRLLSPGGRLGIIVSNTWLGTDWGETFRELLRTFFWVESVSISGCEKWFSNADVVTTTIVMTRRDEPDSVSYSNEEIKFATVYRSIQTADNFSIDELADRILSGNESDDVIVRSRTAAEIGYLESYGLEWGALFADLTWFADVAASLIPARTYFRVERGERRGWDKMFYPNEEDAIEIESEYLKPALKSPTSIDGLMAHPDSVAFCCSESIEDLRKKGHYGALAWIKSFESGTNTKGEPLPKVLKNKAGAHWYEMDASKEGDLVLLVNPDRRLFVSKVLKRSLVNQRLIGITAINGIDIDLCHALLNSIIGLFYIEALGFGRGLGALDLNSRKMRKGLHILSPNKLTDEDAEEVKNAFQPLLNRSILPLEEELIQEDRLNFDQIVLSKYNLERQEHRIRNSLLELYAIRRAVKSSS